VSFQGLCVGTLAHACTRAALPKPPPPPDKSPYTPIHLVVPSDGLQGGPQLRPPVLALLVPHAHVEEKYVLRLRVCVWVVVVVQVGGCGWVGCERGWQWCREPRQSLKAGRATLATSLVGAASSLTASSHQTYLLLGKLLAQQGQHPARSNLGRGQSVGVGVWGSASML
jgi:hypothetical protein